MNDDGSRRWMKPRPAPGRFLKARRAVAYTLIAVFALLPLLEFHGRPLIQLDIVARRFHILGRTFYPTDTLLLALLAVSIFLTIFWITALLGRLWCGWACPQTVYLEFLYRPIERFFEGTPGRAKKGILQTTRLGTVLKHIAFVLCSLFLAHTFLSYFVSWESLREWVTGSPTRHAVGFGVVMFVTAAMMFDFAYFREQVCLVACPYGRLQSVLLDRHSMIIRYDERRGEPRSPRRKEVSLPVLPGDTGDCIDCRMCVTTCPTGIDIRNGLQMECIGCAQCIDACNAVMDKINRPRGLIRYSSQAAMRGEPFRVMRPRVVLYPIVLAVLVSLFTFVLLRTGVADVTVLRGLGQPFTVRSDGSISNSARVTIVNRLDHNAAFSLALNDPPGVELIAGEIVIPPGKSVMTPVEFRVPREVLRDGRARATIRVTGPEEFATTVSFTLLGPAGRPDRGPADPMPTPGTTTNPSERTGERP